MKAHIDQLLDALLKHREQAHGFRDVAEYAPDGCAECDRLQDAVDRELSRN